MADRARAQAPARPSLRQGLPYAGLVVAGWAMLAPYVLLGPDINAAAKNEVADHVVPGVLIVLVSVAMLVRARSRVPESGFPLVAGLLVALAGVWMAATHLPLVNQARRGEAGVTYDVAAWHTIPGVVVLVLGLVWAGAYWSSAPD